MIISRAARRGLAVLSGALLGLAFPPTGLAGGSLAFIALVPLLIAVDGTERLKRTFWTGFLAMFVLGLVANYWVGGWKAGGGGDPFLMMGGVLLALVHPLFLVVPWVLYDVTRRRFGRTAALYALPIYYAGFEYAHSFGDLSYPWLSLFNTQSYNLPYIQLIEFTGPYFLTMLIVLVNVELFQLIRRAPRRSAHLASLSALIAIPIIYGAIALGGHEEARTTLRVTIVQPNIDPWAKWTVDPERALDTNFTMTKIALAAAHDSTDLLLWPETAITFFITQPGNAPRMEALNSFLHLIGHPILTGFPDNEEYVAGRDSIPGDAHATMMPGHYFRSWNAAMLLHEDPDGTIRRERYHKQKLVPLGEHVPFVETFPFLGRFFQWGVGLGSWNMGEGYDPMAMPLNGGHDTLRVSTAICYESVYPSFLRHFVAHGANLLAIITNDGWYGFSSGPYQHEQFAVFRAIENRRYVVRSANTGISAVIDDRGRTLRTLPLFESGSITARVPLIERQTLYSRLGDYIAIPAMLIAIGMTLYALGMWAVTAFRGSGFPRTAEPSI